MRVALLTTGKTEMLGLPSALASLFPGHEFDAVPELPGRPFRGFTTHRLPPPPDPVPLVVDKLAGAAVSLIDPDTRDSADFAFVLDDLELINRAQPEVVAAVFRSAVERHLERYQADPVRLATLRRAVQRRVSFHLVVPMIEAWFFGAPSALTVAGVSGITAYHVRQGDPEAFESTDTGYLGASETACTEWCRRRRQRGDRPKWISAGQGRPFHPKGYLQWLLIDAAAPTCTSYAESVGGRDALIQLDWGALLANPARCLFARALIEDLTDALGQSPAVANWAGSSAPATSIFSPKAIKVLRNL